MKISRIVAALVLALGILIAPAAPASAAGTCNSSSLCLFQATGFNQERWQTSFNNINGHFGACLNIPPAAWSNGTGVSDNTGSLIINNNVAGSEWQAYEVVVFNWVDCQQGGGWRAFGPGTIHTVSNLNGYYYNYKPAGPPLYHTITSVGLWYL